MLKINYQKGFVAKNAIKLIVLVLIVGVLIYAGKQKLKRVIVNNTSDGSVQNLLDLKTYTNKTYGYSFQYYGAWTVKESSDKKTVIASSQIKKTNPFSKSVPAYVVRLAATSTKDFGEQRTKVGDIQFNEKVKAFFDVSSNPQRCLLSSDHIGILTYATTTLPVINYGGSIMSDPAHSENAIITNKDYILLVSDAAFDKDIGANIIYSSLKFINGVEAKEPDCLADISTTDWKTYTNAIYKISFQYPSDWKVIEPNNTEIDSIFLQSPRLIKYLEEHPGDAARLPFYDIEITIHGYQKFAYNPETFHSTLLNGMKVLQGDFDGDGVRVTDTIIDRQPYTYVISNIFSLDTATGNKIISTLQFKN